MMLRPFNLFLIMVAGSVAVVCTSAAYEVGVGNVWGVVLHIVGVRPSLTAELMVDAGQQLSVAGKSAKLEDLSPEEVSRRLAWAQGIGPKGEVGVQVKDGWIAFQGQTLESVVAEFNRHNVRQLVIGAQTTGQIRVGGKFRTTDIEGFVDALAVTHGVKAFRTAPVGERPEQFVLEGGRVVEPGSAEGNN